MHTWHIYIQYMKDQDCPIAMSMIDPSPNPRQSLANPQVPTKAA